MPEVGNDALAYVMGKVSTRLDTGSTGKAAYIILRQTTPVVINIFRIDLGNNIPGISPLQPGANPATANTFPKLGIPPLNLGTVQEYSIYAKDDTLISTGSYKDFFNDPLVVASTNTRLNIVSLKIGLKKCTE